MSGPHAVPVQKEGREEEDRLRLMTQGAEKRKGRTIGFGWRTMKRLTWDVVEEDLPSELDAKKPRPAKVAAARDG